jgi:Rrf2 family protein
MIHLPKRILFSITAVLAIARQEGASPLRSTDITEREGIPTRYLEPVLQQLVRKRILIGVRGPAGGYRLARAPEKIKVGEIVRIVAGSETQRESRHNSSSDVSDSQVVRSLWEDLQAQLMRQLDGTSIADLRTKGMGGLPKIRSADRKTHRASA